MGTFTMPVFKIQETQRPRGIVDLCQSVALCHNVFLRGTFISVSLSLCVASCFLGTHSSVNCSSEKGRAGLPARGEKENFAQMIPQRGEASRVIWRLGPAAGRFRPLRNAAWGLEQRRQAQEQDRGACQQGRYDQREEVQLNEHSVGL